MNERKKREVRKALLAFFLKESKRGAMKRLEIAAVTTSLPSPLHGSTQGVFVFCISHHTHTQIHTREHRHSHLQGKEEEVGLDQRARSDYSET